MSQPAGKGKRGASADRITAAWHIFTRTDDEVRCIPAPVGIPGRGFRGCRLGDAHWSPGARLCRARKHLAESPPHRRCVGVGRLALTVACRARPPDVWHRQTPLTCAHTCPAKC